MSLHLYSNQQSTRPLCTATKTKRPYFSWKRPTKWDPYFMVYAHNWVVFQIPDPYLKQTTRVILLKSRFHWLLIVPELNGENHFTQLGPSTAFRFASNVRAHVKTQRGWMSSRVVRLYNLRTMKWVEWKKYDNLLKTIIDDKPLDF